MDSKEDIDLRKGALLIISQKAIPSDSESFKFLSFHHQEEKIYIYIFLAFYGISLIVGCSQCSALNPRCSKMFITESVMATGVKTKVSCYSSEPR